MQLHETFVMMMMMIIIIIIIINIHNTKDKDWHFKRSSSCFKVSCQTLSWRSSLQTGPSVRQAGILSHVTETWRTRTRAHGYDNYVKRYRFLTRLELLRKLYVICCKTLTTLALRSTRRKVSHTQFTLRCFMTHRHLRMRTAEATHLLS
jgi:hypothetical protein